MGVTAIKYVANLSPFHVTVTNKQNPSKPMNRIQLGPNSQGAVDIWIPWCVNDADYRDGKYIDVEVVRPNGDYEHHFVIWQAEHSGADLVRHRRLSAPRHWGHYETGFPIKEVAQVNGDRGLVIIKNGHPRLEFPMQRG